MFMKMGLNEQTHKEYYEFRDVFKSAYYSNYWNDVMNQVSKFGLTN